jgi:L-ribulose-5-phosphate 4-epimerase
MLEQLKQALCELHMELPRNNLVTWTSGNVSAWTEIRVRGDQAVGVRYEALRPSI